MTDPLVKSVKEFLNERWSPGRPVLLGFSGGPDSLALLHLLLECVSDFALDLHLAHIDHGWREGSAQEAERLAEYARKLGLPFHLHRLEDQSPENLEAKGREARLKFFSEVYAKIDAQALLLAHQSDDLAETILKKVLEGSHLLALHGMRASGVLEGMQVWRPLLSLEKRQLEAWLAKRGLVAIEDATNHDPRFLRGRMRTEILPQLAQSFGKEISANLIRLGTTLGELAAEIETEVQPLFENVQRGPLGAYLEVPSHLSRLKRDLLVKKFLNHEGVLLSHESYDALLDLLEQGAANRSFLYKEKKVIVDRGILFVPIPGLSWTDWEYGYELLSSTPPPTSSWRDLWQGRGAVALPEGSFEFLSPEGKHLFPGGSSIKDWWQEHYIPAFMRALVPVVAIDGRVVHEFLTGRKINFPHCNSLYQLTLKLKL